MRRFARFSGVFWEPKGEQLGVIGPAGDIAAAWVSLASGRRSGCAVSFVPRG